MRSRRTAIRGFTLVELLIVVIILGVIAGVMIPKFAGMAGDANDVAIEADLKMLRSAVERYYHEHGAVYPGRNKATDGSPVSSAGEASQAFTAQLTQFTNSQGMASVVKAGNYLYGPYLKSGIPVNPYNHSSNVTCNILETDITVAVADLQSTGWKFYVNTGRIVSNHDSTLVQAVKESEPNIDPH